MILQITNFESKYVQKSLKMADLVAIVTFYNRVLFSIDVYDVLSVVINVKHKLCQNA